jgi:hypothetical protein
MLSCLSDPQDLHRLLYRLRLQTLSGGHGRNAQRSRRPGSEGHERAGRKAAPAQPGCLGESTTGIPLDFRCIVERVVGTAWEEPQRSCVEGEAQGIAAGLVAGQMMRRSLPSSGNSSARSAAMRLPRSS